MRARDLGIFIGDLAPGPFNAITDLAGVRVGHATLISGDGPLVVGEGPIRTGVTVILPHVDPRRPVFAGSHTLMVAAERWSGGAGSPSTPCRTTGWSM